MPSPSTLDAAIRLALLAHEGQRDWNGRPFITHPLRVSQDLLLKYDELHASVGVLHDAVEDSNGLVTSAMIEDACGSAVAEAVQILTHVESVPYEDYIRAVSTDMVATRVKLADLTDNIHPWRLMCKGEKQAAILVKHGKALQYLRDHATKQGWL